MSDENATHFQFRLGGLELEISGEREFVESMYRRIMRDVEAARKNVVAPLASEPSEPSDKPDPREKQILWVHRCSPMMHKIYMTSPAELDKSPLLRMFETLNLSVVYVDKNLMARVLPRNSRNQTLWAELTEAGRRKIAQAAEESEAEEVPSTFPSP